MDSVKQLVAVAEQSGRVERLGDIIKWVVDNQNRLEQLNGFIVVRDLLMELQRLNALDSQVNPE